MTHYTDTHIHLDQLSDPAKLLAQAETTGVGAWIVPGISPEEWPQVMAATALHKQVYAAPGVHPQAADRFQDSHLIELRDLLTHEKSVAIGEVGLDQKVEVSRQTQEDVLVAMIRLAREVGKPLLLHARRSSERLLNILQQEKAGQVGGIYHAFSGSMETARKLIDLGFLIGIGGVVTFSAARRLPEIVRELPAEALVLETDAPWMTPEPYRGHPNRPAYLDLIARRVADLRGWSLNETARITTANAWRILRLPPQEASSRVLKRNGHE